MNIKIMRKRMAEKDGKIGRKKGSRDVKIEENRKVVDAVLV